MACGALPSMPCAGSRRHDALGFTHDHTSQSDSPLQRSQLLDQSDSDSGDALPGALNRHRPR